MNQLNAVRTFLRQFQPRCQGIGVEASSQVFTLLRQYIAHIYEGKCSVSPNSPNTTDSRREMLLLGDNVATLEALSQAPPAEHLRVDISM